MQDKAVFQNKIILPQHLQSRLLPVQQKIVRVLNTDGLDEVCAKFGYSKDQALAAVERIQARIAELQNTESIVDPEERIFKNNDTDFPKPDVSLRGRKVATPKASIEKVIARMSDEEGIEVDSLLAFKFNSEEVKMVASVAMYVAYVDFRIPKEKIAQYLWCQVGDVTFAIRDVTELLIGKDGDVLELYRKIKPAFVPVS